MKLKQILLIAFVLSLPIGFSQNANAENQCDNSAAIAELNSCKTLATQEKGSCVSDCQFYREDPCYGECESNYNQCVDICTYTYDSGISSCEDIFKDNSVLCDNGESKEEAPKPNDCSKEQKNLDDANQRVQKDCNDNQEPLCQKLKTQLDENQAIVDNAQKTLDWDKSEKSFLERIIIPNQKGGYATLLEEYASLQNDVFDKKARLNEVSKKFSQIKAESDKAWIEALAGTGGPAGFLLDMGMLLGKFYTGEGTEHMGGRVMIDAVEPAVEILIDKIFEISFKDGSPLPFVGVAYDGLELQKLRGETREVEHEYNQVRGWYEDALTALNSFKKRQDFETLMDMENRIEKSRKKIKSLDMEIDNLEKRLPVMKHTLGIVQEMYDDCRQGKLKGAEAIQNEERCRNARQNEEKAENALNACQAK